MRTYVLQGIVNATPTGDKGYMRVVFGNGATFVFPPAVADAILREATPDELQLARSTTAEKAIMEISDDPKDGDPEAKRPCPVAEDGFHVVLYEPSEDADVCELCKAVFRGLA